MEAAADAGGGTIRQDTPDGRAADTAVAESTPDARAGDAGLPPVRRTVEYRNPFGNLAPAFNLAVDGDCELTGTAQGAWFTLGPAKPDGTFDVVTLQVRTGGLCRSGLRCAVVRPGTLVVTDLSLSNRNHAIIEASAKPPNGDCAAVTVFVFDQVLQKEHAMGLMSPLRASPDDHGWCRYRTTVGPMASGYPGVAFRLRDGVSGEALADDVTGQVVEQPAPAIARAAAPAWQAPPAWLPQLGAVLPLKIKRGDALPGVRSQP